MFDSVAETLHELYGRECVVTLPGVAPVEDVTVRCQGGQASAPAGRRDRRDRTTALLYLRQAQVATRPVKETRIEIDDGSTWAGRWVLDSIAEPTADGEWRCLCLAESTAHTITSTAGAPRPRQV